MMSNSAFDIIKKILDKVNKNGDLRDYRFYAIINEITFNKLNEYYDIKLQTNGDDINAHKIFENKLKLYIANKK